MIFLRLFFEFFKTGLFAIGGGMATIPFLYDLSDATGWFTHADLANMIAVGESTPGPIGVNMATYVGYTCAGIGGAAVATLGLITPSLIIILMIAAFLKAFRDNRWVNAAFYALRPASTAMVAAAGVSVALLALWRGGESVLTAVHWKGAALAAAVLVLTRWVEPTKKLHPIVLILASAVVGAILEF